MNDNSTPGAYTLNDYQRDITHTYRNGRPANNALGLAGEAAEVVELLLESTLELKACGDLADVIKKAEYHKRPLDRAHLVKELGDRLWYTAALAKDYGISLEEIARANIAKLVARYPNGFVEGGGNR